MIQAPRGAGGETLRDLHEGPAHDASQILRPVSLRSTPLLPLSHLRNETWARAEREPGSVPRKYEQGHCTTACVSNRATVGGGQAKGESYLVLAQPCCLVIGHRRELTAKSLLVIGQGKWGGDSHQ